MRSFQVLGLDRSSFQIRGMNEELPGVRAVQDRPVGSTAKYRVDSSKGCTVATSR
jgi:hypothetical protein